MNQRQKLVQQQFLNDEERIIKRLHLIYSQSLAQVNDKIKNLQFNIDNLQLEYDWMDDSDPKKAQVKSMIQSKIYQKQYQEQLQKQLDGILDKMQTQQYLNVSDYLDGCYEDGFVGTMFDMHGQGVPLMIPLDQEAMVRAVQLESKISEGLYTRLGTDVDQLKIQIRAQVSRGIASGMTYAQTAKQLANYSRIGYNKSIRIARTEGHRIQTTAAMDACHKAKERGADVLKQWDATLDDVTRESHRQVDGEIRELDESFSNGLDFPGDPAGGAGEVVNCRCALLQRARWALDESELHTLEERAAYYGLDKAEQFNDFKKKYLKAVSEPVGIQVDVGSIRKDLKSIDSDIANLRAEIGRLRGQCISGKDDSVLKAKMDDLQKKIGVLKKQTIEKGKLLVENMNTTFKVSTDNEQFISMIVNLDSKIEYKEVMKLTSDRAVAEIIDVLGGGDTTGGSCASVGLGYIGQRKGWDVLDFRDGTSRDWFSGKAEKLDMWKALGVKYTTEDSAKSNLTNGKRILDHVEKGKEYYLSVGRHATVVRKNEDGTLQYLELQSARNNGWTDFRKDVRDTLRWRFGCTQSSAYYSTAYLTDLDDIADSPEFRTILGYINTNESMQRKGSHGTIK